jgi:hypothetical protein
MDKPERDLQSAVVGNLKKRLPKEVVQVST